MRLPSLRPLLGALLLVAGAERAAAQSCAGSNSCATTMTASVTVPALVSLGLSSASLALTPPAPGDLTTGYVQDNGPTITVKANRSWTLAIHTTAPTNWTYTGANSGVKPITDLTWSNTSGGTYAAITASAVAILSNQAKTNGANPTVFFRTLYPNDYSDARNAPGVYDLPVVFTLSAP